MNKILWTIFSLLFITGCAEQNAEAPSTTTEQNYELQQIANDYKQTKTVKLGKETNSIMNESEKTQNINKAENLVRRYLEVGDSANTFVEYDHKQDGKFVIHVYDVIKQGEKEKQIVTRGWYSVTLNPEHIEVIK